MKKKIISLLLMLTLLTSSFALPVSAIVQAPVHTEAGTIEGKEDAFPAIQSQLASYQHGETITIADDGYIGIPVYVTVYNDPNAEMVPSTADTMTHPYDTTEPNYASLTKGGKPVILYVINTNTERVGTESDVNIITSLLEEGYIVLVVDYKNEKRSATPDLDWSMQKIRAMVTNKNHELNKFLVGDLSAWTTFNYVLPAGYSIKRGVQFFNFEDNGVDGVLDFIVDVWNVDLKYTEGSFGKGHKVSVVWGQKELYDGTKVYQDAEGKRCIPNGDGYVYYTQNADYSITKGAPVADSTSVTPLYKSVTDDAVWTDAENRVLQVRYTNAEDFWDCVKPNGERIDLNLYMDIYYPVNPENKVPVMLLASSSQNRAGATQSADRPISSGYMFNGYAFVNYDHAYVPMSRADHFDYFEGDPDLGRNSNFTVVSQTGVQAQTAATRIVRYLADYYPELFAINVDKMGVWGHSKGAHVNFLSEDHPEQKINQAYFPTHTGECTKEQPWLTYRDGTAIPSNVQFVYSSKGGNSGAGNQNGSVPFFISHPEADTLLSENARYAIMLTALRATNTPSFAVTMEGVGHTTVHGYNDKLDLDMYQALFDFTDYFLYDKPSTCAYILPINGTTNVDVTDDIVIKFTGPIPRAEIEEKVRVVNVTTGESVRGVWESACGGNEWVFRPMSLEGGTTYRVDVPADLIDEKGNAIKAEKNIYFRTSFENTFKAAEVVTTNGSLTLSKTESGANGVYFVFNPLNAAPSFGTVLRFSSTAKASTSLNIYGVTSLDKDNITASTLTAAPIATVGVAGAEIVEADVSEYIASLPEGASPVFYVEAAKEAGTKVIYDSSFNTENDLGPLAGKASKYWEISPNGTYAFVVKNGKATFISNIFTNTLTEADYGRCITVSFDVLSTISIDFFARFTVEKVIVNADGSSSYVDDFNDTGVVTYLTAGEWQRVTLTYLIDDYTYTAEDIQKRSLMFTTSVRESDTEKIYIDNLLVTETVADVTISDQETMSSIAPTLALKSAVLDENQIVGGGYIVNGEDSDKSFDGKDGYHISGPSTSGMGDIRVSYFEVNLASLDFSSPYALALYIKSGSGTMQAYGLTPQAMEGFDLAILNYQNAPALDRADASIIPSAVHGGAPLQSYEVKAGSSYVFGLTRYLLDMKAAGQTRAVVVFATDDTDNSSISFTLASGEIQVILNSLNFDNTQTANTTTSRPSKHETYDYFVQLPGSANTMTVELDDEYLGNEGGKRLKIANDGTSDFFALRMLKLINTDNSRATFTEADVGKTYYISFRLYIPSSEMYTDGSTKNIYIGLSHIKNNKNAGVPNYYGTSAGGLYGAQRLTTLKVGEWNEISYSFTVSEAMTGMSPTNYSEDIRPLNFTVIGLRGEAYLDDFLFYEIEDTQSECFSSSASFTTGFSGSKDVSTHLTKGGDPTYAQLAMDDAVDGYVADITSFATYDRVFFQNTIQKAGLDAANIGEVYTIILRLKASKAGSFRLDISNRNLSGVIDPGASYGLPAAKTVTITEEDVGKWITVEYSFTLTQSILDLYNAKKGDTTPDGSNTYSYAGAERFGLRLYFSKGFSHSASDPVHIYVDTFTCYRNAPLDDGLYLQNAGNVTVSMQGGTVAEPSIGATELLDSTLKKGYFSYTVPTYGYLYGATLSIKALSHANQAFHLYAIKGLSMPELLTWSTAPGNNQDGEGVLAQYAYKNAAYATFTFDENGNASIDVSELIEAFGEGEIIFVITANGTKKEYGDAIIEAPVLSLYTPAKSVNVMEGIVAAHNVVITDKLSYNLYIPEDKNVEWIEYAGVRYAFDSLPTQLHANKTYKRFTADIIAKDAFLMHSVTVYLCDGNVGVYDLSIHHYLEDLYTSEEKKLSTIAGDMLSYLAATIEYFNKNSASATGAAAIRNHILGENYDSENPAQTLSSNTSVSSQNSGIGAGMYLAERPTFYFVTMSNYEGDAPIFKMGEKTLSYTTQNEDGKTYFLLTFSPVMLRETVSYTIGDKSGVFNLRAYYDYASEALADKELTHLVERLYRYSESLESYLA